MVRQTVQGDPCIVAVPTGMNLNEESQAMNARKNEFSTPINVFPAPVVTPSLESASISPHEFASGSVNAIGLTGANWRARCACEKVLPRQLISWRTAVDLNPGTNSRIGSLERRPRECVADVFELLGVQKVV